MLPKSYQTAIDTQI